jgi:hypothetical protein
VFDDPGIRFLASSIFLEHILQSENRLALNDSLLTLLEIYNDAGHQAINLFKSQFLDKEVEAEVCRCFAMISSTFRTSSTRV